MSDLPDRFYENLKRMKLDGDPKARYDCLSELSELRETSKYSVLASRELSAKQSAMLRSGANIIDVMKPDIPIRPL